MTRALARTGWAFLLLASCGQPPNDLRGSIGLELDLEFERVELLFQAPTLRVDYVRGSGDAAERVCMVSIDAFAEPLRRGTVLDDSDFLDHVLLARTTADRESFPPMAHGFLELEHTEFALGLSLRGELSVIFIDGNTLFAEFEQYIANGELTE